MTEMTLRSIGFVHSDRKTPEDDGWDVVRCFVELDEPFSPEALAGLDAFSHVEVVFFMDRVHADRIETCARHPRDNRNWPKVGIFAQGGKSRPNRIGTTICRVDRIEGLRIQ